MSDPYTKLFSSITESTIWREPAGTRLVWITMLARCNRKGEVYAAIPGLADLAKVSIDECLVALDTMMKPDRWSRTKDYEGRRIEEIDGGWRILNHAKFDRLRSDIEAEERERERKAKWDRENRGDRQNSARRSHLTPDVPPTTPDVPPTKSDAPPAPTVSKSKILKPLAQQVARFEDFWSVYPNKKGRRAAEEKWRKRGLDAIADRIIEDVGRRMREDREWIRGYIPHGSTYINGEGWRDGLPPDGPAEKRGDAGLSLADQAAERARDIFGGKKKTR